jgi:translation initiation factor RLI1
MDIKNYDIPTGMTGKINQFLKVFDLGFLERHGIELQRVTVGNVLQRNVNQYLVKTPNGKMAVGKANESTSVQSRIAYLGNKNWKVVDN